jgi:hypothetical protein
MLKESVFERVAEEYGTSIGVATIFKTQPLDECKDDFISIKEYNEYEDELTINNIICKAIDINKYNTLQRKLYEIKLKGDKRLKDLTIYRKAWKETINNNDY